MKLLCSVILRISIGFMYVDSFLFRVHKRYISELNANERIAFILIFLFILIVTIEHAKQYNDCE